MRKLMVLLLAVVMAIVSFGLGGCSKQQAGPTAQPAKQESAADLLGKGKNLPGLTYDYVTTMNETRMTGKVWMAGKKMKTETMEEKQKMIAILDGEANVVYNYMPEQNMIMKLAFDPGMVAKTPDQYGGEVDAAKVKVLETTMYDGVRCKVLLVEEKQGQAQTKMWVREDYGIPLRVEVTETGGGKLVMEYKNMKIGALPADTFQLPAGVPVTDMSEMMKQTPKQP
ncbi:hypothetical protein [Sporomusa sp.]|uniref:LolA family protein n=1 Tax=Sporomusa sp. TaxID=2078658 RepID=UPI002B60FA5E|nr:hypothetical protein [Sporomusa sp.]HWR41971.1 hypothetical protein [Sporomusa sp.]